MKYQVHKAVVVGAGTMGASLAAHFANAGIPVTLLDIVPKDAPKDDKKARNKIVESGWDACMKGKPANIMSSELKTFVSLGNLEDDFHVIGEADLVIEAIIENLKIKQGLMDRIDAIRKPNGIIATNTSGITIKDIAEGRSEGFRQHFLGMHFFNPPRYLKLLEVIPTDDTLPDVVEFISHFGEFRLGKGIVLCKDTPNFIGNRLAFGTGSFSMNFILENGYTVDEVDNITGPLIGRPKTATFRLMDLVGIDIWQHVGKNLGPAIPHDELGQQYLAAEKPDKLISAMVERGWLGNKTNIGFYKMVREDGKKKFLSLDLETLKHTPSEKPRFDSIGKAKKSEDGLASRLKVMLDEDDKAAKLVQALTYQSFQYASSVIPEIADTPKPLDDATRWGFMHEAGPFETWDMLGVKDTLDVMKAEGYPAADWVETMLKSGKETFYQYDNDLKVGVYDVTKGDYVRIERTPGLVLLSEQKEIARNAGATLYDMGDGVACVEFHTKMNSLDDDIFNMILDALDRVETEFDGMVIGNGADNFSAGANLGMIAIASQQKMWDQLDEGIRKMQNMNMRMRYFPKPVVIAPAGMTLAGGCEISMHASRLVAAAETYTGLVETGVAGVIPAGGGTKEYMRRIINPGMRVEGAESLPFMQRALFQIFQAKVSTSAWEAREMGILGPQDRIVLNRDHLLTEAKKEVLHMINTDYAPPAPEPIHAAGRDMLGAARISGWGFTKGGFMSEHDLLIAQKLAYVMTGGGLTRPQWVSEQYILDLEREVFLSLCGEEKTQARLWAFLNTGKPLRN